MSSERGNSDGFYNASTDICCMKWSCQKQEFQNKWMEKLLSIPGAHLPFLRLEYAPADFHYTLNQIQGGW